MDSKYCMYWTVSNYVYHEVVLLAFIKQFNQIDGVIHTVSYDSVRQALSPGSVFAGMCENIHKAVFGNLESMFGIELPDPNDEEFVKLCQDEINSLQQIPEILFKIFGNFPRHLMVENKKHLFDGTYLSHESTINFIIWQIVYHMATSISDKVHEYTVEPNCRQFILNDYEFISVKNDIDFCSIMYSNAMFNMLRRKGNDFSFLRDVVEYVTDITGSIEDVNFNHNTYKVKSKIPENKFRIWRIDPTIVEI